jgi:GNAT superfamily N-acetyltransferase
MNISTLIELQLELECIRVNQRGYLEQFPCSSPDKLAWLYVMFDGEAYHRYLHHALPPDSRQLLKMMTGYNLFADHDRVQALLLEYVTIDGLFSGKTYIFPEAITPSPDPDIVYRQEGHLCGVMIDNVIVSSCSSVRENDHAAEAWVQTDEAHRRKGYGKRVVRAWAQRIRALNKIPFYSHALDNHASQHLAAGMQWIFDVVAYE